MSCIMEHYNFQTALIFIITPLMPFYFDSDMTIKSLIDFEIKGKEKPKFILIFPKIFPLQYWSNISCFDGDKKKVKKENKSRNGWLAGWRSLFLGD